MLSVIIPVRNEYENLEEIESQFKHHFENKNLVAVLNISVYYFGSDLTCSALVH